jgi:hypothetical protein
MRIFLRFYLFVLCVFGYVSVQAQTIANYSYTTNTNGSLEDLSVGSTTIMTGLNDDAAGTNTAIGFDFNFMGVKYTHFSANSNGQMMLHTSGAATPAASQQSSLVANTAILAPMTGDNEVGNGIRIKVIGSAPNRKLVVEWNQFYVYFTNLTNAGNMQVWIEETTGKITYVYGEIYNSNSLTSARSIFLASSNTATTAGSITVTATPTFAASATLVSNTFAAGSGTSIGSPLIADLGSASNSVRRFFAFTPPSTIPADPITLSYTGVTVNLTTVNWIDNSTDENFFIVTRATDAAFTANVVTSFVSSTTTATTGTAYNSPQTGLLPSTLYYYKIQAATEAGIGVGISGSQVTNAPGTYTSAVSGDWTVGATWVGGIVPTQFDNAVIDAGHTVTLGAVATTTINNLTINGTGTLTFPALTATTLLVSGSLDVMSTGTLNMFTGTTGKTLNVKGNVTNNGTIDLSKASSSLQLTGTMPQSVTGAGTFATSTIVGLTFNNTSTTYPSITWGVNGIMVSGTTAFTAGRVAITGNWLSAGTTAAAGTLTVGTGGILSGTFGRGHTAATTGGAIGAGADPSSLLGRYPFIDPNGLNRSAFIERTGPTGAGILGITFTPVAGTSVVSIPDLSPSTTVEIIKNDTWAVSVLAGTVAATSFELAVTAPLLYGAVNPLVYPRLVQSTTVIGTNQAGTVTGPTAQRTGTLTQLTSGAFYLGNTNADIPFVSLASGDWNTGSTWNKGTAPTCTDKVNIVSGHTVAVTTAGAVCDSVFILTGGILNLTAGDLTVDCTNRNGIFSIAGGRFEITGGTLNVNGKFELTGNALGVFVQSAGDIIVDGNSGTLATSTPVHVVDLYSHNTSTLQLTGGNFTVVDPPLSTSTTNCAFKVFPASTAGYVSASGSAWNLKFGNGVSTQVGGHSGGFLMNLSNTNSFKIGGTLTIDLASTTATNRWVTTSGNIPLGNLTITSGDYRASTAHFVSGNITNNGIYTGLGVLNFSEFAANAGVVGIRAQSIGGTGNYRNIAGTETADLVSITVNNNSTDGVTLDVPLSISGTLLMTKGLVNTTATNLLRLGTITATATLSTSSVLDATTHINGPMARTHSTATATNTFTNTHLWPVGKGGQYLPIWMSPTLSVVGNIFTAEAFDANGGTSGSGVTNLSTNTWRVTTSTPLVSGNFVHTQIADANILTTGQILQASNASAAYGAIPTGSLYTAGNPLAIPVLLPTLKTNPVGSPIPGLQFTGFLAHGDLTPCVAPTAQATSFVASQLGSTSFTGSFTPASPVADGYLVVRYASPATPTAPASMISYALGATLGTGTVVSVGSATTFPQTLLTPGITYEYYVYAYNGIGCGGGPLYNTTTPLIGTVATCAGTVAPVTLLGTTGRTQTSISIAWTASTTVGATYEIDVATDAAFLNVIQNANATTAVNYTITGLTAGTTYHYRVRAFDPTTMCYSTNLAGQNGTLCLPSAIPYSENLNGALGCLSILSTGVGNAWGIGAAPTTPTGMIGNTARIASSTTAATNNYFVTQAVTLVGGTTYDLKFKYGNTTTASTLALEMLYNPNISTTGGTVISTLPTIANTTSATATLSFTPTTSGDYFILFRASGPVAGTISTVHIDDIVVEPTPACTGAVAGSISAPIMSACGNTSSTTLSASGYTASGLGLQFQWEKSNDNFVTDINPIVGATSPVSTGTGFFATGNNYYRLKAECTLTSTIGYSNVLNIAYSNPSIASTAPATRCGVGTVTLGATPTNGTATLSWYASATGGSPIGSGSSFTTPSISASTDYYVSAVEGGTTESAARPSYSGTDNTTGTQWGLVFNVVSSAITLNSVDVFSVAAGGNLTIELRDNTGALLQTSAVTSYGAGSVGSPLQVTIPLGFTIPVGTGYRLVMGSMGGALIRNSSLGGFPYTSASGNVAVTNGYISGTSTTYYWFYNWSVSSGCEGIRTAVTATVATPPVLTLSTNAGTICQGASSSLVLVTSTISDFDTYAWSPATGVAGDQNAGYTFNPATTTSFTLTATQTTGALCQNVVSYTSTVNPAPVILAATATPSTVLCNEDAQLNVQTGSKVNVATFFTSTGNTLADMTTDTMKVINASNDDTPSGVLPLGFNFIFDGTVYTNYIISPDGWVRFGNSTGSNEFTNDIVAAINIPKFYAYWDDLATGTDGYVSRRMFGTAPNRYIVFEWRVTIPRATVGASNSTFQTWIYEGTNVIEHKYGVMGSAAMSASVGLTGNTPATNYNSVTISTNTNSTSTPNNANANQPAAGTMYRFTPKTFGYAWSPSTFLTATNIFNPVADNMTSGVTYNVVVSDPVTGCTANSTPVVVTVTGCNSILSLSQTFIEGYMSGGNMVPVLLNSGVAGATAAQCDTITVALHNATSPYAQVQTQNVVLGITGAVTVTFPASVAGNSYYIVIKGRNIVETWSANPVAFTASTLYNFGSASQAYGMNLGLVGTTPVIYSGDIDHNGVIDLDDYPLWENDYNNFGSGYISTDIDGSGAADLSDYPFWENGYNNFIGVQKP